MGGMDAVQMGNGWYFGHSGPPAIQAFDVSSEDDDAPMGSEFPKLWCVRGGDPVDPGSNSLRGRHAQRAEIVQRVLIRNLGINVRATVPLEACLHTGFESVPRQ